jgi:hypothetical protein
MLLTKFRIRCASLAVKGVLQTIDLLNELADCKEILLGDRFEGDKSNNRVSERSVQDVSDCYRCGRTVAHWAFPHFHVVKRCLESHGLFGIVLRQNSWPHYLGLEASFPRLLCQWSS